MGCWEPTGQIERTSEPFLARHSGNHAECFHHTLLARERPLASRTLPMGGGATGLDS